MNEPKPKRTIGWMGIHRGHRARPVEWIAEKVIFLVSLSAIVTIFLIFVFVTREAIPVLFGRMPSRLAAEAIKPEDIDKVSSEKLRSYLGLSLAKFNETDRDTLKLLLEVREEAIKERPTGKDAGLNTTRWRYLLFPYQWSGYEKPEYIWQPIGQIHKYNIVPLLIGSLKVSAISLLFGVPMALGAAIYVSQLTSPTVREILKPSIELLSGIPSVVLGFFALIVMATFLQNLFGYQTRLNAFVAGIALSLAVIPLIFSIAEDALTSVPKSYTQAALALGSSRWQAAWKIVLPAAIPGVFAAIVLGFGRAIGETMIVLMTSSASVVSWSVFDSTRPITATIAAELSEAVFGSGHYRVLFMLGALLFTFTFGLNMLGGAVIHRLKRRLEGRAA